MPLMSTDPVQPQVAETSPGDLVAAGVNHHHAELVERVVQNISRLIDEVNELREEKKNLSLEIASLNYKLQSMREEMLSSEVKQARRQRHEEPPPQFAPLVLSHDERLLLKERLTQVLAKINLELQQL